MRRIEVNKFGPSNRIAALLLDRARAGRRRALAGLARGARGVAMLEDRARPPRLTVAGAKRLMAH